MWSYLNMDGPYTDLLAQCSYSEKKQNSNVTFQPLKHQKIASIPFIKH